ncbi:MAG: hypothetical protein WBQ93_02580 [Candidatus Competibacter sp.]
MVHATADSKLQLTLADAALAHHVAGGVNIGSAVYGTIVAIAVIGAWYADPTSGALETLTSVAATLIVFWIAHAYAHVVGQGLPVDKAASSQIFSALRHDWPIIQAGVLPLIVLGTGALHIIEERLAILGAIASGVVMLMVFSVVMARAAGRNWLQSFLLATIFVGLGIVVAVLEIKLG